jgi:hypothetical protein
VFARVHLEAAGLIAPALTAPGAPIDSARVASAVDEILAANPHLLAYFSSPDQRQALASVDREAARELIGWAAAQHVEREEPQIAYELGMLALGVELPGILVGALRDLEVHPDTTVAELPDGSGYPTVFLATLHPHWRAAERARLFVAGADAEQLAAWAFVVLGRQLAAPGGRIVRVSPADRAALHDSPSDVTLVYNPVSWLGSAAGPAQQVVVL